MDIRSIVVAHPAKTYLILGPLLALFALTPTPHIIPIVGLLTCLRLWSWTFFPRPKSWMYGTVEVLAVSLAAGVRSLTPSLHALSTPTTSLVVLSGLSTITSAIVFALVSLSCYAARFSGAQWMHLTLFPALWASAWGSVSQVSPVGQLATWSPMLGLGPYAYLRQFFGQWGIDWVVAAWAVVFSEILGDWLVGIDQMTEVPTAVDDQLISVASVDEENGQIAAQFHAAPPSQSISRPQSTALLAGLLLALTIPSSLITSEPLPPQSTEATPFTVGCALPAPRSNGHFSGEPTLNDFILESKTLQAHANVIVWPEGAVRFDNTASKEATFKLIQENKNMANEKYWGISFEEYVPPEVKDGVHRAGIRRNGFALLGKSGPPVLEYYKRKLVPIAESFSLSPGSDDPEVYTIEMPKPSNYNQSEWAPGPKARRPIPVTASICLDFSSSSSFKHLETHPALILAPARTWHTGVGFAMWEQAKARAAETGSTVVWCDGGEGGVSGVAGGGYSEIVQVGQGSWIRTIGIGWPFDQRRTIFLGGGDYAAFVTVWAIFGLGWVAEVVFVRGSRNKHGAQRGTAIAGVSSWLSTFMNRIRSGGRVQHPDEHRPLLE